MRASLQTIGLRSPQINPILVHFAGTFYIVGSALYGPQMGFDPEKQLLETKGQWLLEPLVSFIW